MSKVLETPQFTLQIESALRHLVRENGSMSLHRAEALYRTPAGALKQWIDRFNNGKLQLSNARIDEVKREVGAIVVTKISAPARPIKRELPADDPEAVYGRQKGHEAPPNRNDVLRQGMARAAVKSSPELPPKAASGPVGTDDFLHWLNNQGLLGAAKPVTSYLVEISPEMAVRWLTLNKGNRVPSRSKIRRFAAQIKEGSWKINGESVKFSKTGRLIDGQSRLRAIVEAAAPAVLEVRAGLDDDSQATMDAGQLRTNKDTMEMKGEKYPQFLAPALKLCRLLERRQLGRFGRGGDGVVENFELIPCLARHPKLRESVSIIVNEYRKVDRVMPHSRAAFWHYTLGQVDRKLCDEFFKGLVTGCLVRGKKSVAELAGKLMADKIARVQAPNKRTHNAMIVMVWNHLRAGTARPDPISDTDFPDVE